MTNADDSRLPRRSDGPTLNRRQWLAAGGAISAAAIVPRHVLGGPRFVAPSDKINVALVGAGGRGLQNARELMKLSDVRIPIVVDPAQQWDLKDFYYRGLAGREPVRQIIETHFRENEPGFQCRGLADFREMLAEPNNGIDAILCATPDHLHATVSIAAMKAGKHVYCEKPLTHNVAEARRVAEVARESGVATQMGNQGHSRDTIRETCELIWAGAIGDVQAVHAWVPATRWNKGMQAPPTDSQPLPAGLDWDLWCGPRVPPDFHSAYAPVAWRDFWTFGCGAMGDFGCHDLDSAVWALDLGMPTSVEMHAAGNTHPDMAPWGEIGYFDFSSARVGKDPNKRSPIRVHWYSGGLKPSRPTQLPHGTNLPSRGVLFIGSEGVLVCGGAGGPADLYPVKRREAVGQVPQSLPRSAGHHRDWIDAIKGQGSASSEFHYGAKLTEITLLGLVALRSRERIEYDAEAMKVTNSDPADQLLHGQYRNGWELA
ncbi:Gfo/Idh/MocA family protein [Stieleria varia]|nr:Gfo/Idh/MocA family oxidoreductase [Stieleria varia]